MAARCRGARSRPSRSTWPANASAALTSLGLMTAELTVAPTLTAKSLVLKSVEPPQTTAVITAKWWEGPQGVVSNPAEPALPLAAVNVTPTMGNLVLRGVGFRGGNYADDVITPLTGAPTTELRGVHVPFVSPVFFPMRPWTVNYFGSLGGNGATGLLVTPAQHRAADIALGTSTRRTFSNLDLRLFYSGNLSQAALSDAPSIVFVDAQPDGGGVAFTAQRGRRPGGGDQSGVGHVHRRRRQRQSGRRSTSCSASHRFRPPVRPRIRSCGRAGSPRRRSTCGTSSRRRTATAWSRSTTTSARTTASAARRRRPPPSRWSPRRPARRSATARRSPRR